MSARPADDEEVLGKAYDARLMRRLLGHMRPYRLRVGLAVAVLLAASGLELLEPYLTKIAIDGWIARGDASGIPAIAAVYVLVLLAVFALRYLEDYLTAGIGQDVSYDLRRALFRHLQALSVRFFDRTPVGRVMTRVIGDVDVLNEMFTSGVVAIFGDVFILIGIVAALFALDARLALATLLVLPPLALATQLFRVRVRAAFREVRGKVARVNAFLQESIVGMSVVQLFRREAEDRRRFDRINAEHRDAHLRTVLYYSVYYPVVELLSALAVGLIVWKGGLLLGQEAVTLGVLVAFIQYAKRFFQPIMDLSEKYNIMQSAMASSERIFELLDTPVEVVPPAAPEPIPPGRPDLVFDRVSFAYNPGEPVLREVSFSVPAGATVAVVGATGSGKTTLANLALRFYDVRAGEVRVGGVDVRRTDPRELRRRIAYVQQDVFLFSGSLLDNIRLGADLSREAVEAAAQAVAVARFAGRLPRGYDTDVRERGNVLSTGQKALVALARALAADPDVLILDEATASVDTVTEAAIQGAIRRVARGRTTLVIAHRLSTIRDADRIVVLHKGRVREAGTHDELLRQDGIYRRLHDLQFGIVPAGQAAAAPAGATAP